MCELLGYSCRQEGSAASSLQRFAEHSDRNPHGWGLVYYTDSGAILKKKAVEARKSAEYYDAIRLVKSKIIISHIRHASCGKINEANCHPFMRTFDGKDWVFAHNGHIDGVGRHPMNAGETDSESFFHMLMDSVREHRAMDNGVTYHGIVNGRWGLTSSCQTATCFMPSTTTRKSPCTIRVPGTPLPSPRRSWTAARGSFCLQTG
jgi:predicted glutamine amidotransferase